MSEREAKIMELKYKIEQNEKYLKYTDPNTFLGRLGIRHELKNLRKQLRKLENKNAE